MRCERGQASVEWVAVVALVAVVFAVVAASATGAGATVANGVQRGVVRALCLVTGRGCLAAEVEACAISRHGERYELGVKVLVVEVGQRGALARTVLSDGTIELTLLEGYDGGVEASLGELRLRAGGRGVSAAAGGGATLRAGADRTRTWRVRDAAAAHRLQQLLTGHLVGNAPVAGGLAGRAVQHALGTGVAHPLPPADVIARRVSVGAEATVELAAGQDAARAGATGTVAGSLSVRRAVDRRTGRTTTSYELRGEAAAELRAVQQLEETAVDGVLGVDVTTGRDGRLLAVATTELGPKAVPDDAPRPRGGDEVETTRSVDLTADADAARTTAALVAALHGARLGDAAAAARALRPALDAGQVDVRAYASREDAPVDVDVELGLGVGAGVRGAVTHSSGTLRDAWSRPAGGLWEQRADCLPS